MKKAVLLFLATILMALPFTFAEEGGMDLVTINVAPEEEAVELPEDVIEEAGITPDNPLWGLERAREVLSRDEFVCLLLSAAVCGLVDQPSGPEGEGAEGDSDRRSGLSAGRLTGCSVDRAYRCRRRG